MQRASMPPCARSGALLGCTRARGAATKGPHRASARTYGGSGSSRRGAQRRPRLPARSAARASAGVGSDTGEEAGACAVSGSPTASSWTSRSIATTSSSLSTFCTAQTGTTCVCAARIGAKVSSGKSSGKSIKLRPVLGVPTLFCGEGGSSVLAPSSSEASPPPPADLNTSGMLLARKIPTLGDSSSVMKVFFTARAGNSSKRTEVLFGAAATGATCSSTELVSAEGTRTPASACCHAGARKTSCMTGGGGGGGTAN
mmetsp:Transcript_98025/g.260439  ORF Transcript_98025/g.260439 Transcript_98025/m.260439 type:complete len:257 (+) Transcript_98025:1-771(+)